MLLEVSDLTRIYRQGTAAVPVLEGVGLTLDAGRSLAVTGRSGSGKSTLLNLLAGLDEADRGSILWRPRDAVEPLELVGLDEGRRTLFRRRQLGFVFQFFNLVPTLSALENVQLMAELNGIEDARSRAQAELSEVGLDHRLDAYPSTLSGGEQQRVAIARALVHRPLAVLADEPTGNLDLLTADTVFAHLLECTASAGVALILVTHDPRLAERMDERLDLETAE